MYQNIFFWNLHEYTQSDQTSVQSVINPWARVSKEMNWRPEAPLSQHISPHLSWTTPPVWLCQATARVNSSEKQSFLCPLGPVSFQDLNVMIMTKNGKLRITKRFRFTNPLHSPGFSSQLWEFVVLWVSAPRILHWQHSKPCKHDTLYTHLQTWIFGHPNPQCAIQTRLKTICTASLAVAGEDSGQMVVALSNRRTCARFQNQNISKLTYWRSAPAALKPRATANKPPLQLFCMAAPSEYVSMSWACVHPKSSMGCSEPFNDNNNRNNRNRVIASSLLHFSVGFFAKG